MKKEFMEPEMRRIELNLKERIATSYTYGMAGEFRTRQTTPKTCTDEFVDTEIYVSEWSNLTQDMLWSIYTKCGPGSGTGLTPDQVYTLFRNSL